MTYRVVGHSTGATGHYQPQSKASHLIRIRKIVKRLHAPVRIQGGVLSSISQVWLL